MRLINRYQVGHRLAGTYIDYSFPAAPDYFYICARAIVWFCRTFFRKEMAGADLIIVKNGDKEVYLSPGAPIGTPSDIAEVKQLIADFYEENPNLLN